VKAAAAGVFVVGLACISPLALGGCSTAANPGEMSSSVAGEDATRAGETDYHGMRVGEVAGGSATNFLLLSSVSNGAFKTALEQTLRSGGYLADDRDAARLEVRATIVELDQPAAPRIDPLLILAPIDWSVSAQVRYTVVRVSDGVAVFDTLVGATGTANGAHAVTTDGRIRLATEAAMRANVAEFVSRFRSAKVSAR
jgi:hypothetical protein